MVVPPISLALDVAVPFGGIPFTIGGMAGFTRSEYKWSGYNYGYTYSYNGIAIAGRFAYHPNFEVENLDVYAVAAMGYYIYTGKGEYHGDWGTVYRSDPYDYSEFFFGINAGARYFFTNNIGVYGEVGYSALTYISLGLALKF
jgi:hypothetical protein